MLRVGALEESLLAIALPTKSATPAMPVLSIGGLLLEVAHRIPGDHSDEDEVEAVQPFRCVGYSLAVVLGSFSGP